jgi:hypothetical protein
VLDGIKSPIQREAEPGLVGGMMSDENAKRKKHPLTWLDLLPLVVGFGCAIAVWSAGVIWVIYR